jgi:four helix bundle protein
MTRSDAPGGRGAFSGSPPALDSRGAPGDEVLPQAETAIAAAHKLARMIEKDDTLDRGGQSTQHGSLRAENRPMQKKTQDAGSGEQGTGHREYRLRTGDNIAAALLDLGADIIRLLRHLPDDRAGRHLASQLFRCTTSPGANYEEARAAESRADFVHKISIAAKEMRESCYWIALLERSGWVKTDLKPLVDEAERLAAILGASARTARRRAAAARR